MKNETITIVVLSFLLALPSFLGFFNQGKINELQRSFDQYEQNVVIQDKYIVCLPMGIIVDDEEQTTEVSLNCDYGSEMNPGLGQHNIRGSFAPTPVEQ